MPQRAKGSVHLDPPPPSLTGRVSVPRPFLCAFARLPHPSNLQGHCGARGKMPGQGWRVKMSVSSCARLGYATREPVARCIP